MGFPGGSDSKESACNAVDPSSIPASGRSPGEGIGYPLQYSWASLVAQRVKNPPAAGDLGSIPGLGRSPGGGYVNPLQYSCLENPHGHWSLVGYSPWNSPGQNPGVGSLSLSRGSPNPGIEPRSPVLHSYSLPAEPQGKSKNAGWVAYPFSRGSSQTRN